MKKKHNIASAMTVAATLLAGLSASLVSTPEPARASVSAASTATADTSLRIATYNIRCDCSEANPLNTWSIRKTRTATAIKSTAAAVVGLQEPTPGQYADLFGTSGLMGSHWNAVNTPVPGSLDTIAWDTAQYTKSASGFKALTTGPVSAADGTRAYERAANWVVLRARSTGQEILVVNTHLEHRGANTKAVTGQTFGEIRTIQTREVLDMIRDVNVSNLPTFLLGDFNSNVAAPPYLEATTSGLVKDARALAQQTTNYSVSTFNSWAPAKNGQRVDFVFASPAVSVTRYSVATSLVSGLFPSDHFPVVVDAKIPAVPGFLRGARVFSVPTSDTLYAVSGSGASTKATVLTFSQWQALGAPKPVPAPVAFVKYAWSQDVFMVNFWTTNPSTWSWTRLTPATWGRAGFPKPNVAGWISGTSLTKLGSGDQIFATLGGVTKSLSWSEWQAMNFRPFVYRSAAGYVKKMSAPTVYWTNDLGGNPVNGTRVSFNQWVTAGGPTPAAVSAVS